MPHSVYQWTHRLMDDRAAASMLDTEVTVRPSANNKIAFRRRQWSLSFVLCFFSIRRHSARSGNVRIMALSTSCTFDRFGDISDRTIFAEFTPILRSQWSTFRNSYLAWSSILRKSSTFNDHGDSNDLHIPILKLTFKYRNQNVKIWKNHPFPTIINITIEG